MKLTNCQEQRLRTAIIHLNEKGIYPSAKVLCIHLGYTRRHLTREEASFKREVFEQLGLRIRQGNFLTAQEIHRIEVAVATGME